MIGGGHLKYSPCKYTHYLEDFSSNTFLGFYHVSFCNEHKVK